MHPSIRKFPSMEFYDDKIQDHDSVIRRKIPQNIKTLCEVFQSRLLFFDIYDSNENSDEKSRMNLSEAEFTKQLLDFMAFNASSSGNLGSLAGSIGVISPYKQQVLHLKVKLETLCKAHNVNLKETIEVNTVDAFQGREKDIIIFNCVRANSSINIQSSLGFLTDQRRLNVAITRPKHMLIIVGNAKTLSKSPFWHNLISHYSIHSCKISLSKTVLQSQPNVPVNLQKTLYKLLKQLSVERTESELPDSSPKESEDQPA